MVLLVVPRAVRVPIAQLIDELDVPGPLRAELLDPSEGGLRRQSTRVHLVVRAVLPGDDTELLDDKRKRQPLTDEGDEDDREDEEQDQIPFRKADRKREGRGERHNTAKTRPRDDEDRLPRRIRVDALDRRYEPREVGRGVDPHEARDDYGERDGHGDRGDLRGVGADAADDARQLQPDQHEHEAVEEEQHHLPCREPDDARVGRRLAQPAAREQTADDRGEHARDADGFGRQIRGERRQQRDHDGDPGVADAREDPRARAPNDDADREPAEEHDEERAARVDERERAGGRRGDREAIDHESGRVVHQALALEDRHDAARHAHALEDGGRGDRVGRRHDGAECERAGPAERRHEHVRDDGDRASGEDHETEGEEEDRPQVGFEITQRREITARKEQRRQEHEEDELGWELEGGKSGDLAQQETAQHHDDRIREGETPRDERQREHRRAEPRHGPRTPVARERDQQRGGGQARRLERERGVGLEGRLARAL